MSGQKNVENIYPLAPAQQGMLFHSLYEPESRAYVTQVVCRAVIDDPACFERAWEQVVQRHSVLRSAMLWENLARPMQAVGRRVTLPFTSVDWRDLSDVDRQSALKVYLEEDRHRGFKLSRAPLMRLALQRLDQRDYQFVWTFHHIVLDGWSVPLLFGDLLACYAAAMRGEPAALPPARPYADYIAWLQQQDLVQAETYWKELLAGFGGSSDLGIPTTHKVDAAGASGSARAHLSERETASLQSLAQERRLTLSTIVHAAWALVLSHYSGESDVVFGTTVSGRPASLAGVESMVGVFINVLPARLTVAADTTVVAALEGLQRQLIRSTDFQHTPLLDIQRWSGLGQRTSLFDTVIAFENYPAARGEEGAGSLKLRMLHGFEKTNYPLSIIATPGRELALSVLYDTGLFDAADMQRLAARFRNAVLWIAANMDRPISNATLLDAAERELVTAGWNATARDYPSELCLHDLVERQVRRTPDAPALRLGRTELTYAELNGRANQLARFLRTRGVGPEVLVGLCLQRSLDLIVAMLAVLKAGGAYVPIDPDLPEGRLAFMLDDSAVPVLLTHSAFIEKLGSPAMQTFCIDTESALWNELPKQDLPPAASSDNLAYAIYTSGSTGRPKGAMNAHQGIVNRILWMQDEYGLVAADRMLQKAPFSFDVSLWEIFWPLSVGALVVVAPPGVQRHAEELIDVIAEHGVTSAHFVPSMLQLFLESPDVERCKTLTRVFSGGEPLTVALQNALFARLNTALVNQYGPTETAVDVTWWPCVRESDRAIPIGRPSANVQLYVLDRRLEPVPVGVQGELHVGGIQVARGYLHRAALTAERFIPDPFSAVPGARLYRTGDVVRQRPDGNIEYLGRVDHQVKIRGNRIELGEIEKRIVRHPAVKDAVVAAREDQPGNKRLVCYAVCGSAQPTTSELRRFVADALPDYMVPSAFVFLDALPRFLSGKIDRRALPAPAADRPNLEQAFAPPQTDVEEKLAGVWEEVLRVDRVGVHDNFFELGGDSILSLQIVWKANQRGIRLTPRELFEHPTIAELAAVAAAAVQVPVKQEAVAGRVPLTPIAHRFFEQKLAAPSHFNQAVLLEVRNPVNESVFRRAASALVEHHDALRLSAREDGSTWTQEIAHAGETPLSFERVNLAGLARAAQDARINEDGARLQASLDLSKGPIVRFALFDLGPRRAPRLLIVVHHLAIDVVSWRVLLDDLETVCGQIVGGAAVDLPARTTPFRHWAEQLATYARSAELRAEAAYWLRATSAPQVALPVDRAEGLPENTTARTRSVVVELSARETKALLQQVPKAYGGDVPDVLLTAAARIIGKWMGSPTVLVDLEGHGREPIADDLDLSRTVGWFTTAFPVALEAGHDRDLGDALRSVKEALRAIPRKGIGYGVLRYIGSDPAVSAELAARPQPQVSFNYLGRFDDASPSATRLLTAVDAPVGQASSPKNARAHLIDINAVVRHGRLTAEWRFCDAVHDTSTVEALATGFIDTVRRIVAHCASCRARVFTPSDFPLSAIGQRILDELQTRYRREGLEDVFTASSSQQGILYHAMTSTTPGMYVTQVTWQLSGWLNRPAFKQAWQQVIDRHPILRAAFVSADEPHAIVCRRVRMPWREADWRELTSEERIERFRQFIDEDQRQGFDLQQPPLLRSALFRLEDEAYQFVWTIHHSIMDGWSLPLVLQDVFTAYDATCSGRDAAFQPRRPFRDYIAWLQRRDSKAGETYWRRTFGDVVAPTPLPVGTVHPGAGASGLHASASAVISGDAATRIQQFARAHDLTINTVVQGAWVAVLARHARERDVIYGTTVAGRPADLPGADAMIGVFINTLPMRVPMTDALLPDWLRAIQQQQTAMREHEQSSLAQVQKWSGVGRGVPLFESIVVFENYPTPVDKQPSRTGLQIHGLSGFERVNYPLALVARAGRDLAIGVHYDCDYYRAEDAAGLLDQVCEVLNAMPVSADRLVADLAIVGTGTRERILGEWSRGDVVDVADSTIVHAFERHARVSPSRTALEMGDSRLSYAELNAFANAIAATLRQSGLTRGGRVAVCAERSIEMVAAFLGILKAGGVYVPVDPSYPAARVAFMLSDASVAVTLTQASLAPTLAELRAASPGVAERVILLESIVSAGLGDQWDSQTSPTAEDAAYLIYTSGSTGQPKGVVLEHRGLSNVGAEQQRRFGVGPADRVLQFSSSSFDASVFDFSMALASGATLLLAPRHDLVPGPALLELLRTGRISVLTIPPSALAALPTGDLPDLRVIAAAGEPCPAHLVDRWGGGRRFFNLYGPTEATIWTTALECVPGTTPTIGRPIANVSAYVLDRRLNPVPAGMAGELYIGGRGVARGYLGRPSLTADRFIPDPFCADRTAKLYRTGDIVRFTSDGEIEFVGRADQQIKIRGFRIEPGEVEAVLRKHPAVAEAAVVTRVDTGDRRLVGYIVTRSTATVTELAQHLKGSLPAYMVPEAFVFLPALPLTVNGKLDVAALPAPGEERPDLEGAFVGPRSPIEDMLATIWSELLGIGQVGVHDNFFDLGGHSLLATRLVARVRDAFAIDLPLKDVFESPTIAETAERIAALRTGSAQAPVLAPISRALRSGPLPLSLAQRRLWFLSRFAARQYHVAASMRLLGPLDVPALERAIRELVHRHESLRTAFPSMDGGPVQHIGSGDGCGLALVDLRGVSSESREGVCAERLLEMRRQAFDLETGPLFRAALVQLSDDTHVLALVMHHIVADAWSIGVMWRELGALYGAFSRGESSPLAEPELQYSDYAVWQQEWIQSAAVDAQLSYWRGHLAGAANLQLPTDRPRPPVQTFNGAKATAIYAADLIDRLKELSRERGSTFFMTLLAAFAVLLHRYADQDDIVVGTPTAGRNRTEVESLVGFFINTLVLRTDVSGDPTFIDLLDRVKRATLDGFANQEVPFDRLVEALHPERDPSRNPLFQVAFALQNAPLEPLRLPGVALVAEPQQGETTRFDIELHLVENSRGLAAVCSYNTDLYDAATIARFLDHYRVVLEGIAANPARRVDQLPLMTEGERRSVLGAGAATATGTRTFRAVHETFAEQAHRTPDAIAVSCAGLHCTYQDLDLRANQLAHHLIKGGVDSGDLVGIYLDRSIEMLVSIAAILKAGAAYLPLDPVYPADRLAFMLGDAGVSVVVSSESIAAALPHPGDRALDVVCLDRDQAVIASHPATAPRRSVGTDAPAYVIYTSGSTGRPKGVVVTHGNVARLFEQTDGWFGFGPADVWTLFHSYAFDFSVWEIWGALLYGGRLVVVPYEISRSPSAFHELLRRERVTVLNQTPSAFRQLIDADSHSGGALALRWVVFGGEALDPQTLQPWFDRHGDSEPQLVNMYGITETTVHVTFRNLSRVDGSSSRSMIGRAIPDLELYVLDNSGAPAPVGVPGELYVGGAGVARGYLNRPALTAERFVPHPFALQTGARLYKTGDLARRLANGDVEYVGRADHQVKIRGFRIELGEIEAALNGHAAVREAVVTRREDRKGDARLVAYLVPDAQAASPVVRQLRLEREGLPEGVRPYELPNGMVVFHRNKNETDFLYREIFGDASYLRHGIDLPENACVFDVGANTGLFTAFVRSMCPGASVFAFEPIPPVFEVLSLNARLHGDGRVRVFDCGLSDRPSEAEFTYYPHLSIMSGRFADTANERGVIKAFLGTQQATDDGAIQTDTLEEMLTERLELERVTCRLRTVSDIVREHAVARIDLLKVDVEKSELEVLLGIDEEDWPKIRQVVVEVHDFDGRLALIKDLLNRHGFTVSVEQEASLQGTGLHNIYASRASMHERPSPAAAPVQMTPAWLSERAIVDDARALVKRSLPEYMVPSAFVVIDALPMTPSGKLDRQALPAPERRTVRDVVAPASDLELAIAEIWREVLDVDAVGAHDNFFDLGGHSLLLARVHELLGDRLGLNLSIVDLFRHPTVSSLAVRAEQSTHGAQAAPRAADSDRADQLKAGRDRLRRRLDQRQQVVKA